MNISLIPRSALLASLCLLLAACGDNVLPEPPLGIIVRPPIDARPADARAMVEVPEVYGFESRFAPGQSGVSYVEENFAQVLIDELDRALAGLTAEIDSGALVPAAGDVQATLDRYYRFSLAEHGRTPLALKTDPPTLQPALDSAASGLDQGLDDLIAGTDPERQHRDFRAALAGWSEDDIDSPDQLVALWIGAIDALAVARAAAVPTGPDGEAVSAVYITDRGQDLRALLSSFLLGAVSYWRATDIYLDDATPGSGLLASNARLGEQRFSQAESHWDRAYGLFGSSYEYNAFEPAEAAGNGGRPEWSGGYHDSEGASGEGNGRIDLTYEYNYGTAALAARLDAADGGDRGARIFSALVTGRAVLQASVDELSAERMDALVAARAIVLATWEQTLADAALGALTDTEAAMDAFGTDDYDFAAHARHWSLLKGYALGLQFNPASALSAADLDTLHQHLGQAPALPDDEPGAISAYRDALGQARALLEGAYGSDGDT